MPEKPEEITEAEWNIVWDIIDPVLVDDLIVFEGLARALAEQENAFVEGETLNARFGYQAQQLGGTISTLVGGHQGQNSFPLGYLDCYPNPVLRTEGDRLTWDGHSTELKPHTNGGHKIIYRKLRNTSRDD